MVTVKEKKKQVCTTVRKEIIVWAKKNKVSFSKIIEVGYKELSENRYEVLLSQMQILKTENYLLKIKLEEAKKTEK